MQDTTFGQDRHWRGTLELCRRDWVRNRYLFPMGVVLFPGAPFHLAQSIRIDPAWQQVVLELRSEAARLDRIDTLFRAVLDER